MPFTFKLSQRLARMRCAALLLSTAALAACELPVSTDESGTTAVSRVVVSPKVLTLQPYQTADFVAVTLTNGGDTATATVSWSVTSGSITDTSTSSGRHYGRFKASSDTGKVKVVANGQPGQGSDTAIVTIAPAAVASVTVSPTSAALQVGQTQQFTATTRDSVGNVLTGRTIAWASGNTAVITVSSNGVVTAVAAGTAGLSAVSGGQVGTATVTVTAPPPPAPPPVASVTLSPASANVGVGGTQPFIATLRDASGNVLTGRAISWSSSAQLVATVSASGVATALVAGTTTISAISEGRTGTASLTVTALPPPPPVGSWPNEPAGFTTLTDNPFSALTGGGWDVIWNTNGYVTIGVDAAAPASPASVLQVMYPQGFQGGSAPGTEIYSHASTKEVFAGFWWKPSDPWQNHGPSNVNKIAFWFTGAGSDNIHLRMYGPGPYTLQVSQEFSTGSFPRPANVNATPVTLGKWHRIEWYIKYATTATSGDGVVKWWLDGVLQGSYTDMQTPNDGGFSEFKVSPTWGGMGDTKTETDYYWYDQIHLSRR